MKLTADTIAEFALPNGKDDAILWDEDTAGFGYRLRAGGNRSWIVQFRVRGKTRRMSLRASKASPSVARTWAKRALAAVALGQDPAPKIEDEPEAISIGKMFGLYLDRQRQRLRPNSFLECERHLRVHAASLHRLSVSKVDRRNVAALLAKIGAASPVVANATRKDLIAAFSWACREGLRGDNPAAFTNRFAERSRDHVLTDDEIRAVWRATEAVDEPHSAIVRLLMLLGLRRQEIGGLAWAELDLDAGLITLPPARTKNGRTHVIPLPALAIEILEAQPRGPGEHVFGKNGFKSWSRGKALLDQHSDVREWRLHDLRRVVSTKLHEDLLQPPHLIEAILGHVQPGVASVYNKSLYLAERRRVLDMWAEHLTAIVERRQSKVVALAAGRTA
jgi:integrase